jgi:hypothetical protein
MSTLLELVERKTAITISSLEVLLKNEREKFVESSEEKMIEIIRPLDELGVYDVASQYIERHIQDGLDRTDAILNMVKNYGVSWYKYANPLCCPHCATDLRDHVNGPPFKFEIIMSSRDEASYLQCPFCKLSW